MPVARHFRTQSSVSPPCSTQCGPLPFVQNLHALRDFAVKSCTLFLLTATMFVAVPSTNAHAEGAPQPRKLEFSRDIRPILSNKCFTCHGPDAGQRQAGLRLDLREEALLELPSGDHALVPGNLEASTLVARITADDETTRMPPADSGKQLTADEIALLTRWVAEGARWGEHWAFVAPKRPKLPAKKLADWPRNPIDHFVLARLEEENLQPAPEADRASLIRRLAFDLTGLPPTPEEVRAFQLDNSPRAYEKLVERLLASPHYGEHMARFWLDAARYGDTHGLHLDNERSIWPYRDWVINAFNRDMPFDQFTVEQLAGDLLPNRTLEQQIATGFNRCNVTTSEGGSIDAEYLVRYAVDRVETTSTVWMGLTMGCAVCHDHKYDPFTQREFYQLFAYFNSQTERAMDGNAISPPPVVRVPSGELQQKIAELDQQIATAQEKLNSLEPAAQQAQVAWESEQSSKLAGQWQVLQPREMVSTAGSTLRKLEDNSVLAEGENPAVDVYEVTADTELAGITAIRLEALIDASLVNNGPGRSPNSNFVLSEFELEAISLADPTQVRPVKFVVAQADFSQKTDGGDYHITKAIDGAVDGTNGWAIAGYERHEPRSAVFVPAEPIGFEQGTTLRFRMRHESQFAQHGIGRFRLAVSRDPALQATELGPWHSIGPFVAKNGSRAFNRIFPPENSVDLTAKYENDQLAWQPRPDLVDGTPLALSGDTCATYLYRTIHAPEARKLDIVLGSDDAVKVWLNGKNVHSKNVERPLKPDEDRVTLDLPAGDSQLLVKVVNYGGPYAFAFQSAESTAGGEALALATIFSKPVEQRTDEDRRRLAEYFRATMAPELKAATDALAALRAERDKLEQTAPTSLVMQEMETPRDSFVLLRGAYDKPGDKVTPGVPASLPRLPEGVPANRLALANWLVDPAHPLTSRVTVNRLWQQFYGAGIVRTPEDFGSQGEWPTHPELLDWLATEFIAEGWDIKDIVRLMVTSATYRQTSQVGSEAYAQDRENRLLGRGSRFRLDAEVVRDNALALGGLLVPQIGGPSVKPYQPPGIWEAVGYPTSNTAKFVQDHDQALYRRSMYTFWKRTAPPASMSTFDAPSREACTVRRARTNTPLQALALLNDVQFVEAARHFAERIVRDGGETPTSRIEWAFQLGTSREPTSSEISVLLAAYQDHLATYQADEAAAVGLLAVGESKRDESINPAELAAWTMVASTILNLDETVTRP